MRPKRASAAAAMASTEDWSDTSTRTAIAWPPSASISLTVSSASFMSATTTLAPWAAACTAKAWPMPVAPPVTMTVRWSSRWFLFMKTPSRGEGGVPAWTRDGRNRGATQAQGTPAVGQTLQQGFVEHPARTPAQKGRHQGAEQHHAPAFEQAGGFEQAQVEGRTQQRTQRRGQAAQHRVAHGMDAQHRI